MRTKPLVALTASLLAVATPFSPSTAQSPSRVLSRSELQQAAQQHPQVIEQFGGPVDVKLNNYVAGVGRRIAGYTGVRDAPGVYNVTVLNSPVRNAFAVPGGYVYITRELLALMNDEAELAFVLGHEMGHVAARHGQKRQTRSTFGQLGASIAAIVTGSQEVGQIAGQLGQGLILSYSRSQEREADRLGVHISRVPITIRLPHPACFRPWVPRNRSMPWWRAAISARCPLGLAAIRSARIV